MNKIVWNLKNLKENRSELHTRNQNHSDRNLWHAWWFIEFELYYFILSYYYIIGYDLSPRHIQNMKYYIICSTRCDQKIIVIFKFHELHTYARFSYFFSVLLIHMSVVNDISWQHQPFWIVSLFLTDKKVSRV